MRKRDALGILPRAHLPVGRIDARRVDVDEDFPASGDRVGQLPVLEDLRAAEAAEEGGFHRGEPRSSRSFTSASSIRLAGVDRKSTRLNSSHGYISYAVFCLKKKKKKKIIVMYS